MNSLTPEFDILYKNRHIMSSIYKVYVHIHKCDVEFF